MLVDLIGARRRDVRTSDGRVRRGPSPGDWRAGLRERSAAKPRCVVWRRQVVMGENPAERLAPLV